ncbi:MAG: outer spore coat protein CotE [Erysipelotrichaceae bacterium]|nr:outer spore coat protein CotE [Erysipelotrichaceae bacterium]
MSNYREIVTKAVLGKGKKVFTHNHFVNTLENPTNVLGCWVINHNFKGNKEGSIITITGSYDINIWYSYANDTKTDVVKETFNYKENINIREKEGVDYSDASVIVRALKDPNCTNVKIDGNKINYQVDSELGIELIGDTKVKILVDENMDDWEEIVDTKDAMDAIEKSVNEDYLEKK